MLSLCPGSGPYKKWESKPLKADDGQASTSGEDDDEEMGMSPTRRDQCLRYLFFMNGGLLLAVVVIGTLVVRPAAFCLCLHGEMCRLVQCPHVLY
jgi:hypothetical protein